MFDLNSLFNSSGGSFVGVSVTPNVGLEVIQIDKKTKKVLKYGHKPLAYNVTAREIEDYNEFKINLMELYAELSIDKKSEVYLVLPNVHFGFISFPPMMIDEAIENALLSKAEESYIFRRVEPKTAWADVNFKNRGDSRYLAYSSVQVTAVDQIIEKITDIGGKVVGIETSHCAFLRAIHYSGLMEDVITKEKAWNILLINSNSYAIFALVGENLVDYTEIPLALKSMSNEEAYQTIAAHASQILINFPAQELLIISQFNEISAKVLQGQMTIESHVTVLNCNKFNESPFLETDESITDQDARKMTLSAIGAGAVNISTFPLKLNVLEGGSRQQTVTQVEMIINGKRVVVTEGLLTKFLGIVLVILIAIFGAVYYGLKFTEDKINKSVAADKEKITQIETELKALEGDTTINVEDLIAQLAENNIKTISYYDSISADIPKNIWLTSFSNKKGEYVSISGMSLSISDIYKYFKALKILSPNSTIKLHKLKMITDMYDENYDSNSVDSEVKFFTFEIGNMDSLPQVPTEGGNNAGQNNNNNNQQNAPQAGDGLEAPPDLEPLN